jgi:hypothetical protein
MICTGIFPNGVWIGLGSIPVEFLSILRDRRLEVSGSFGAVVGWTTPILSGQDSALPLSPTT